MPYNGEASSCSFGLSAGLERLLPLAIVEQILLRRKLEKVSNLGGYIDY
jgi:hypothetical protein